MPTIRTPEDSKALLMFGQHLANLRNTQSLSQEDVAERCDLDRTHISGIERGKRNLSLTNILKLAKALGITASALMDYSEVDILDKQKLKHKK